MAKTTKQPTRNIRIPMKIHQRIKLKCKEEGRIMGAYVSKILSKAISRDQNDGRHIEDSEI
jgi:hypothetical protein